MIDLTEYGFEVVARSPAMEYDRFGAPFTTRHLKAIVTDGVYQPGAMDYLAKVAVDLGPLSVDVKIYDGAICIFHQRRELLFVFQSSPNAIDTVAELIAEASEWPKTIEVGEYRLERTDLLNYKGQSRGKEIAFTCTGDERGAVVSFEAGVFDNGICMADVSEEANSPRSVLSQGGIVALLKRAIEEAEGR